MAETQQVSTSGQAPASGTPNGGAPQPAAFQLPADIAKTYPGLTKFKDLSSLAKSYGEMEKAYGSSLHIPAADAPPEERDAFYAKLGRPEAPDKYELKFPEGTAVDDKLLGSYREVAHKIGLNSQQAQALAEWWTGQSAGMLEAQGATRETQIAEWDKQLDTEWGWQKDRNTQLAGRALATMLEGNLEHPFFKLMQDPQFGNNPVVIKFFHEMALKQGEDKLISEPSAPSADDRQTALEQIRAIRGDKDHPFNNRKHPSYHDAQAHMQRLYAVAYPKE